MHLELVKHPEQASRFAILEKNKEVSMEHEPLPDVRPSEPYARSLFARAAQLLHRPPRTVPSSLSAVEEYFGEELSDRVIAAAARLTEGQLNGVQAIVRRTMLPTEAALWLSDRQETLLTDQKIEQSQRWYKYRSKETRDFDRLLNAPKGELPWAGRKHILEAKEIAIHKASLGPGPVGDIADVPALKHLALYCQHAAIRDPLYENVGLLYTRHRADTQKANELFTLEAQRSRFVDSLRQLLPIAPLVRSGAFILVPEIGTHEEEYGSVHTIDPFIAWLVEQHQPEPLAEMRQLEVDYPSVEERPKEIGKRLHDLRQMISRTAQLHYPHNVTDKEWRNIDVLARWVRRYSLSPVTSDFIITEHLQQCTHIALNGAPSFASERHPEPLGTAIAYNIPSVTDVSFRNVASLRESNSFEEIRAALTQLAVNCATSRPRDYAAYRHEIAEQAQDVIGPIYDKINRQRRAGKWARLGVTATGRAVRMQLNGVAGSLAAAAVDRLLGRPLDRAQERREVACTVLKSIFLYK